MNCMTCGTALPPGAGFCGACGTRQHQGDQPQQAQPQQAHWQQPQWHQPHAPGSPAVGYPPAHAGHPPAHAGYLPPQPTSPAVSVPPGVGSMRPYPIVFHRGMTRLTGHLYVAPARLYFLCQSDKGGMGVALGKAVGGLIGGAIAGAAAPTPGQGSSVTDESELQRAAQDRPGSLVMDPQRIGGIKDTFWTHAIWFDGTTYALRSTLDKALKLELGQWCQAHGVKHAGLLPKK